MLKDWKQISYNWQNEMISGHIYVSQDGFSVIGVNDFVEMVVLRKKGLGSSQELIRKYGEPRDKRDVFGGSVWSYDNQWSVLVMDGKIAEVWVSE